MLVNKSISIIKYILSLGFNVSRIKGVTFSRHERSIGVLDPSIVSPFFKVKKSDMYENLIAIKPMSKLDFFTASLDKRYKRVVVDYIGCNIGKKLHPGHFRSILIGSALINALRWSGYEVVGDMHLGDSGGRIRTLLENIRKEGLDVNKLSHDEIFSFYPKKGELEVGNSVDPEDIYLIRKKTIDYLKPILYKIGAQSYMCLGEHFTRYMHTEIRSDLISRGICFIDSLGRVCYKCKSEGVIHVVYSSSGVPLYLATDLATVLFRDRECCFDVAYYCVDARQKSHFIALKEMAIEIGVSIDLRFILFGVVRSEDFNIYSSRIGSSICSEDFKQIQMLEFSHDYSSDIIFTSKNIPQIDIGHLKSQGDHLRWQASLLLYASDSSLKMKAIYNLLSAPGLEEEFLLIFGF